VIRSGELLPSPGGTIRFEGESYGSGISFFHVHNQPGEGPDLHRHPYSETWILGDIIVVTPNTPHKFKNSGSQRLDILCIHDSPQIVQEDLE
jgi:hypothetical protein